MKAGNNLLSGTWRMPFSAQKQLNQTMELPNPKATLTSAVAMRPPASSFVGEDRAPSTPDANLEKPYLPGKQLQGLQHLYRLKPYHGKSSIAGVITGGV